MVVGGAAAGAAIGGTVGGPIGAAVGGAVGATAGAIAIIVNEKKNNKNAHIHVMWAGSTMLRSGSKISNSEAKFCMDRFKLYA